MTRADRLAAVIAPVLGLASLWGLSDHTYRQGTEWEVPIQGYDPRDYLRGHYVEFSYDWPGAEGLSDIASTALCLEGEAPNIARVQWLQAGEACDHPVRADASTVYGANALMTGRLYIGQDRAAQLEEELRNRDQRAIVTIRQRDDGSFTPLAIRFRPLTPAEIAERVRRDAADSEVRVPPAIMAQ